MYEYSYREKSYTVKLKNLSSITNQSSVDTTAYFGQRDSSYVVLLHVSFILLLRKTASLLRAKCRISDDVIK